MAHLTNYIAFVDPETGSDRIGHLDIASNTITPLSFRSGTPVKNLYQVIEAGSPDKLTIGAEPSIPLASVRILPPISGRDVLAVGKNYLEHAREFNSSGYDSSDVVDRPSHPVIFTKRATSIAAHGDEILLHEDLTSTADYEGEIGVIIGKPGFRVDEDRAWEYVWGYTIINDVTARERQRDHKQFFLGKSADTYCPMGPIAVPKESLPQILRVQTSVNGEPRQDATTEDLIFPIPQLIAVISQGQTLQPGDVLATGTPAGVGIGKQPPVFLKPGDEISISVTGLGTLQNKVSARGISKDIASSRARTAGSAFEANYRHKIPSAGMAGLTCVNGKMISYQQIVHPDSNLNSSSNFHIIFIHGLGATKEYWLPLSLPEAHYTLHLYDLEGHGLTPTHPLSEVTISSLSNDLHGIFEVGGISAHSSVTLVAHSLGSLVAQRFAQDNPHLIHRLILLNPPLSPTEHITRASLLARAAVARTEGMASVVSEILPSEISAAKDKQNPLAETAVRLSLLGQDPEGYAKGCQALALAWPAASQAQAQAHDNTKDNTNSATATPAPNLGSTPTPILKFNPSIKTVIITGDSDPFSTPELFQREKEKYNGKIGDNAYLTVLEDVGHWSLFEDPKGVARVVNAALRERG